MGLCLKTDDFEKELKEINETFEKKKEYGFDSLVFRYKEARYKQAELDYIFLSDKYFVERGGTRTQANKLAYKAAIEKAQRDIMRFIQILNEMIGEHK